MRVFGALLLILALGVSVQAQADEYRLRVPLTKAYFDLLPNLLDEDSKPALEAWLTEVQTFRRLDSATYDDRIETIFRTLLSANLSYGLLDHDFWISGIFTQYLREGPRGLIDMTEFQVNRFSASAFAVDFEQDGSLEYILKVNGELPTAPEQDTVNYDGYLIAYRGNDGFYRVVDTPMGYNLSNMAHWEKSRWNTLWRGDLNADGSVEWVVADYGTNTGPGSQSRAEVKVWGWNGQELINLLDKELGFNNASLDSAFWRFVNQDDDPALEIVETSEHYHSWGCSFKMGKIADWDEAQHTYVVSGLPPIYPETAGCIFGEAEAATWKGDFANAIPLYEHGITLAEDYGSTNIEVMEQLQYIKARLALAYALTDQPEKAAEILRLLQQEQPATEGMGELINIMAQHYEESQDALSLCTAMYNFFVPYAFSSEATFYYSPLYSYVGLTLTDNDMFYMNTYTPPPSSSGCDINILIEKRLADHPLSMDASPSEIFEALNIPIRHEIDLNTGDMLGWVLWAEADIEPFLFVPDSESRTYHLSRPSISFDTDHTEYKLIALPDHAGAALASKTYGDDIYRSYEYCPEVDRIGSLRLFVLRENELRRFAFFYLCAERTWDELFQKGGREVRAWVSDDVGPEGHLIPAIYTWDSLERKYNLTDPPPEFYEARLEELMGTPPDATSELTRAVNALLSSLRIDIDLVENVALVGEKLVAAHNEEINAALVYRARYYRALALEALNRPDEALAEYIEIFQAAPESVWGQLAALHLEKV